MENKVDCSKCPIWRECWENEDTCPHVYVVERAEQCPLLRGLDHTHEATVTVR